MLGLGAFTEYELPRKVENVPDDIRKITGGAGHSIIIDESGDTWVTGWNNKGQLGIGSNDDINNFMKLEMNHKFVKVSCGWDTSAGTTEDGQLFVWGSNSHNQLGFLCSEFKQIKN